jgi:hypothetical protein
LGGAEREVWRLKDVKGKEVGGGDGEGNGEMGGRKGLCWQFDLMTSLRGIGWNWKVKNIPEAAPATKWYSSPPHIPLSGLDIET